MTEGLPWYSCLIWRLAAKPQIGKDFSSNLVRHHRYKGGYRVRNNSFSVKLCRPRCKPWKVPQKSGNKPGNGVGAESRDVHGPHGCNQTLWRSPGHFSNGVHTRTVREAGWIQRGENHLQIQPLMRNVLALALDVYACQRNTENQLKCYWFFDGIFRYCNHLSLGWERGWKRE